MCTLPTLVHANAPPFPVKVLVFELFTDNIHVHDLQKYFHTKGEVSRQPLLTFFLCVTEL